MLRGTNGLPATSERPVTMCATQTIHTRNAIWSESAIRNAFFDFTPALHTPGRPHRKL